MTLSTKQHPQPVSIFEGLDKPPKVHTTEKNTTPQNSTAHDNTSQDKTKHSKFSEILIGIVAYGVKGLIAHVKSHINTTRVSKTQ